MLKSCYKNTTYMQLKRKINVIKTTSLLKRSIFPILSKAKALTKQTTITQNQQNSGGLPNKPFGRRI